MEAAPSHKDVLSVPRHLAIIMDGNGRWAKARGLPRTAGHYRGAEAVRTVVRACGELGVGYLTLYAFSSENWKRPADEVRDLMGLLRLYLRREVAALDRDGVRVRVIGDREGLSEDIRRLIADAEERTRDNGGLTLTLALNYGGRAEIVAAARRLAREVKQGSLEADEIDEDRFAQELETAGMPDPDLIIRTSGERRLSNFLLWQLAYSELVFVPTYWPDFGREDLLQAIEDYQGRERRYGAVTG